MSDPKPEPASAAQSKPKSMDEIMALCKRRGFVYQASEIYGGFNGFWDYGPLGAQLKKNLRDAWWHDVVLVPCGGRRGPQDQPVRIVPLDTTIIQNPKVWVASGHVSGFTDPMVDCRESKMRYRADHLAVFRLASSQQMYAFVEGDDETRDEALRRLAKYARRTLAPNEAAVVPLVKLNADELRRVVGPHAKEVGTLTEPRLFNLMFETNAGAVRDDSSLCYLRPETAQGMFVQFRNVVDTTRVRLPFGIAQTGKAFRNEVTPRNFTFRSREFEQMEIEFFCHPEQARGWYEFWRRERMGWWESVGLAGSNLRLREQDKDELAHYAKDGAGTSDIEYRFPFTDPGFGELEGVAHRGDFDLRQHQEHSGSKLEYFDAERGELAPNGQPKGERYLPHVIEPSAGLDRGVLALLCEAYTPDPSRPSGVVMRFHPRLAPIKAAVFPLVNKDGMPEVAERLAQELTRRFARLGGTVECDAKQTIGKRYARMDEAGCPYCFTVDGETLQTQTVTIRARDSMQQERLGIAQVAEWLAERLE